MLIKLADAIKVEMWEIFDFSHESSIKELRGDYEQAFKRGLTKKNSGGL